MTKISNQLETVFQEIRDYFENIPRITVTPGEGSPPDQYSVNYQIIGVCKESDGDVYTCENHVVSISLPFGFPHFPPNCLPESLTFHPDFDSSAICIGDIWEADKSLVKLIIHIGRMISGEIYSESNAFNQEAAEWYGANSDQLPFDESDFTELESDFVPGLGEASEPESIDTLDDDDFEQSFAVELDSHLEVDSGVDTDRLFLMAKQKRFQALSRELRSIDDQFEGRNELEEQLQEAMDEAMVLFRDADTLEQRGEQQKALEKYCEVESLVSDYPLLHESKERVQQAFDLLGDWVSSGTDGQDSFVSGTVDTRKSDSSDSKKTKRTFFEDKKAVSRKVFYYALGGGSIALLATLALSFHSLSSSLETAEQRYGECISLLDGNHFKRAEAKCDEALSLTAEVRMVKQDEKNLLTEKIETTLGSQKLRQGLLGNILVNGKYVSKSTKKLLAVFKKARKNGDTFFQKQKWKEAAHSYSTALESGGNLSVIESSALSEIQKKYSQSQFNALVQTGNRFMAISNWNSAGKHFREALELAQESPGIPPEDIRRAKLQGNKAKFNALRDMGDGLFENQKWEAALGSYQQAIELGRKCKFPEVGAESNLAANVSKIKIYIAIKKGKEAFADARWDDVIAQYEKASLLLEENSKRLNRVSTSESREKLSRMMLHALILRDKQDLAKYLKLKNYGSAVEKLQEMKHMIRKSNLADHPEFQAILKEIISQETDTKKQRLIVKLTTYLTDNYDELFLKHYPAAAHSALSAPAVEYQKNIGRKLLFRMQCTETTGGRGLRLQMDYLYNPANKHWQFYSGESK